MYFEKLLIANRGEIARRIIRTARRLGIKTVAVCSEADAGAPFVREADEHQVLGAAAPKESYLAQDKILAVARASGADALHPGYGFLAENAGFARKVIDSGLVFVGPSPDAMGRVGGKLDARRLALAHGVPVVPGTEAVMSNEAAKKAAEALGYPVLIKAAAGGGGIGMSVVENETQLERALDECKKRGASFFGSDLVYVEKLVEAPAHVEVQILGDHQGQLMALGERDCTVQRRHQKIIEESPSPRVDASLRRAMTASALRLASAAGYTNAGTIEMIFGRDAEGKKVFYFLEVNSRIQVEHPVTEMVTGLDIVELQLAIAAGKSLADVLPFFHFEGHAIEARICAEDPEKRFFPSPGTVSLAVFPENSDTIRVDAGVESGTVVPPAYDSLLAKVIARGATRQQAIEALKAALQKTRIEGIKTNLAIFPKILEHPKFRAGTHDTSFLRNELGLKY